MRLPRRRRAPNPELERLRVEAERAHHLLEESREVVVVLDEHRRVIRASRRAREALEGIVEGQRFPDALLHAQGRTPLEVSYDLGGTRETLVYLSEPGDLAAYEELRAGFTAAVSHELRTPLARLLVLLDTAALPDADPRALIDDARREVDRIRELIDDVLFLSELESGRAVVSLGSIRVLPVLEQVVTATAARADRAGVALDVDCASSFELPVRPRLLQVVVANLVENAIRYAGTDSICRIACAATTEARTLTVADDGAGVSEEDLPRLFERFYRGDRGRTSHGTGLGLAIVKHVVVAAGGTVTAEPTPGGGLAIRCTFDASA